MAVEEWEIRVTSELRSWINTLDRRTRAQVVDAIDRLAEAGPALGRPLVDSIAHPWRSAILLTGGDKSGDWQGWYRRAIPRAEELYAEYLKEREAEEEEPR
jgi:hypothetical protein